MSTSQNRVVKIGIFYLCANIFEKALAFFLLPVFTNLLSTKDYGIVSTYISYQNILGVFVSLAIGNSLRGAIVDYRDKIQEYLSSIFILQTVIAILMSGIIILTGVLIIPDEYLPLVIMCPVHSFCSGVIGALSLNFMLQMKYIKRTILSVMPALISIFVSIYLIKNMTSDFYMGRIIGLFSVNAVFAVICAAEIMIKGKCVFRKEYCIYALKYSVPLIFHGLSLVILNQMDRVMITSLHSASETGIYSVAYNFGTITIAFTTAMNDVWIPWFYGKMSEGDLKNIRWYGKGYIWTCVLLSGGVMLLSPDVFKIFTNEAYWGGIMVIPLLVIGNYFSAICGLPINAMYYSKKTKMIALSSLTAMLVNLCANYLLIPLYGSLGAASATVVSFFVLFMMQNLAVARQYKSLLHWGIFGPQTVVLIMLAVISFLTLDLALVRWLIAGFITAVYLYFAVSKWHISFVGLSWKRKKNFGEK